jgi:MFS family permease
MTGVTGTLRALGRVVRNPRLRDIQIAGLGSTLGTWAYAVALPVYAYHAGGARAVGVLFFARFALGALAAPWLGLLADRWSRRNLMLSADLIRFVIFVGMTAVAKADGSAYIVYVLAVISTMVSSSFKPAQAALLPSLVDSPDELAAANVVGNTIASVGMFAGPALGGIFLALSGPAAVFALNAAFFLWSAAFLIQIPPDSPPERTEHPPVWQELTAGFAAVAQRPVLRVVVVLTTAQTMIEGALEVLLVVLALRLLHSGNAGVGWLNTALGLGSLAGAGAVAVIAARRRLAGGFALGILLGGIPLAVVAMTTTLFPALILMGAVGAGLIAVQVTGVTLVQRSTENEVLGRVFAVLESLMFGSMAIGAIVAPGLVTWLGPRGSIVAAGLFVPVLLVPLWPALRRVDAESHVAEQPLELLRRIEIFAELPEPILERLAAAAVPVGAESGSVVVSQGELGDRFYVIAAGRADVEIDSKRVRELEPGDSFGEIALLRNSPRTATVRAVEPMSLYAIAGESFVAAVTGHAPTLEAAELVATNRLLTGALS